jgi:hypothetical protein
VRPIARRRDLGTLYVGKAHAVRIPPLAAFLISLERRRRSLAPATDRSKIIVAGQQQDRRAAAAFDEMPEVEANQVRRSASCLSACVGIFASASGTAVTGNRDRVMVDVPLLLTRCHSLCCIVVIMPRRLTGQTGAQMR